MLPGQAKLLGGYEAHTYPTQRKSRSVVRSLFPSPIFLNNEELKGSIHPNCAWNLRRDSRIRQNSAKII
jgi:hypothetical protein